MYSRTMHISALARATYALAIALLAGCGGGGGGNSNNPPPGGDTRQAALDAVAAKFDTFDGSNPDQENQQLVDLMKARPEFSDAGISNAGGAWGRFTDGTMLVIANNVDRQQTRAGIVRRAASSSNRIGRAGLPTSDSVVIGNSLGTFWDAPTDFLKESFLVQPYSPAEQTSSVEALKALNNTSVLCLTAHGCSAPIRVGGASEYIVWTSTKRATDGSTDTQYAADLQDGSLTYFMGLVFDGDESTIRPRAETHYGITQKFVTKYWTGKFNPNSLIFMNACHSADPEEAVLFQGACLQAGASAYLGWTDSMVIRDGVVSAAFLFDRLAGANTFDDKETPPQRAFSIREVLTNMATKPRPYAGAGGGADNYDASRNPKTGRTAKLDLLAFADNFMQLAPSIQYLAADEQKDELIIGGYFGDDKGEVYINDSPMIVKSWNSTSIVCALPRTGPNAAGDVKVHAAAPRQFSNTVQLTEWRGTADYILDELGSLQMKMHFDLHFRGDVHDWRLRPGEQPVNPGFVHLWAMDSSGTYEFSGNYTTPDGLYTEDWSGSGIMKPFKLPEGGTPPPESTFNIQGSIDRGRWLMTVVAVAYKGNHTHKVQRASDGGIISDVRDDENGGGIQPFDGLGTSFDATADSNFNISGGERTIQVPSKFGGNDKATLTIKWSAFPAHSPPDPQAARSVRQKGRK
jgi:hypothetical protein